MKHLFLVGDHSAAKRVLIAAVRLSMRNALRRGEDVAALVFTATGMREPIRWPAGVRSLEVRDVLTEDDLRTVDDWTYATASEVVAGGTRSLFPVVQGTHLGDLNLLHIQNALRVYGRLAWILRRALADASETLVTLVSDWQELTSLLALEIERCGHRSRTWSMLPPRAVVNPALRALRAVRGRSARRGGYPLAALVEEAKRLAPVRTLHVSWTAPIGQMYEAVESRLGARELTPSLRLHFSGDVEPRPTGDRDIGLWRLGEPGDVDAGPLELLARQSDRVGPGDSSILPEVQSGVTDAMGDTAMLRRLIQQMYRHYFDAQARHCVLAAELIEALAPDLVTVGNDRWWVGQAFVQAARAQGIPTVCLQDGVATDDMPQWQWLTADRIAIIGRSLGETLARRGVSSDRWVVTGQPRYDRLVEYRDQNRQAEFRRNLGLDPEAPYVLFATQPFQEPGYVRSVVDAILAAPGVRLLLRPHPSERHDLHRQLCAEHSDGRMTLHAREDILDLVAAANVLVVQCSTVALEAGALDRPVITANFDGMPDLPCLAWIQHRARNADGVTRMLEELLASGFEAKVDRPVLENYLGPVDGEAGDRVAALLASMARSVTVPR